MEKKISSSWTKHIKTQKEKQEFKSRVIHSEDVLDVLTKLIEEKIRNSTNNSEKETNYEKPSWSEFQADQLGYRRALREVEKLIEIN